MRKLLAVLALGIWAAPAAIAQSDFMVFPQLADGSFPDGTFYRSTLNVKPWLSGGANCQLTLYGMTVDFGSGPGASFSVVVPAGGFVSSRTSASGPLQTGYATLTCDTFVNAQMAYAFYSAGGQKIAEATVFPADFETVAFDVIVDGRDGARTAIAIANNTDIQRTYDLTLRNSSGVQIGVGETTVPARSNLPRFVDEVLDPPPTPGEVFVLEVRSSDFSDFSMIGLQFTGPVFSTVPAD